MPNPGDAVRVGVVGGGPGGLMAAEVLATAGRRVTVFERMPSVGRKLLLAGRGGLNLTHSESLERFLGRYGPARDRLEPAISAFGPDELRSWCAGLGEETVVGSSGRVFPAGFRATPLLRAWLRRLEGLGVDVRVRHTWEGWSGEDAIVRDADGKVRHHTFDALVLALGGASWPRVGSDGNWVPVLAETGVGLVPLRPANCGFAVAWTPSFQERFAGTPLKDVRLEHEGAVARGDAVVTASGIEGGAVYGIAAPLRDTVERAGSATFLVDLRPDLSRDQVRLRLLGRRPRDSVSNTLRRTVRLAPVAVGLLREVAGRRLPGDADALAALIKKVPVVVAGTQPIDRAISTAGGIRLDELDASFMLRRRPGTFVAGEMLDWEAPTGGYLLQATFATGVAAARGAMGWVEAQRRGIIDR